MNGNKRTITLRLDPAEWERLKVLAAKKQTTLKGLLLESVSGETAPVSEEKPETETEKLAKDGMTRVWLGGRPVIVPIKIAHLVGPPCAE